MNSFALTLLLSAAVLHTCWNLIVKQVAHKRLFTWGAQAVGSLGCLPLLWFNDPLPAQVWPFLLASGLTQAAYTVALARAYDHGDFSLIYPLSRGTAPALLVVWAAIFLGERPNRTGWLGLAVLLSGLIVIGGSTLWANRGKVAVGTGGIRAALLVAITISIYSVIDGAAAKFAPALPYTIVSIGLCSAILTPLMAIQYGRQAMIAEWQTNWWRLIVVGMLSIGAYSLVLAAYRIAPVSYGGAIREVSVVLGALAGWRWLGEGFGLPRVIGACLIFLGILLIALAG